ncbi:uncharacterized protein LOC131243759 isoform X2 [Magnolia sinica]|uniref:uncharacterized protein LOC131243759 isoform X2 n=1 Tax=Magnolia sinica TaxID=86752 RepID=UPI00265A6610|nr:uncharacterized protein LOC131243759 isoform X2 [Magnolia sinica]
MEANDTSNGGNDHKRKVHEGVSNSYGAGFEKPTKRIYFPSTRPSKTQVMNFLLDENKRRLSRLLRQLVRERNWKEASGVVSMLLKGTSERSPPFVHRRKYWAAMEILRQFKSTANNEKNIKGIYESWMSKHGWKQYQMKKSYMIQLEFALYCIKQGNIQDAYNTIKFLGQDVESGSDPVVKLMAGLILYQLWYSGIPKEMQLNFQTFMSSEAFEMVPSDGFCLKPEPVDFDSVEFRDMKISQCASQESVGNEVKSPLDTSSDTPMKQSHQVFPEHNFYMKRSAEMSEPEAPFPTWDNLVHDISFPYGLDTSLIPIWWRQSPADTEYYSDYLHKNNAKDYYIGAVRHLKDALYSTPPLLAALLPLIQLLLLNDQVEEALEELKKFCINSNAVLPFRLRAILLECFGRKHPTMLSTCYEDVLKKDPRCSSSLAGLIRLYKNGSYNIEPLLGMIALHLDATYATCDIWGELASCFLELQTMARHPYEEDQMSTVRQMNDDDGMEVSFIPPNTIPGVFTKDQERKSWKLRCRWWATRHFSKNTYLSEMQAGDWQLLTFKAACVAHLYDQNFEYAQNVFNSLKEKSDRERFLFLQMHFRRSMKLLGNLNRTA